MALLLPQSRELTIDDLVDAPRYWIVDPDPEAPSFTALTLASDGSYQEADVVTGDQAWTDPVLGVMVAPSRLVGPAPTTS